MMAQTHTNGANRVNQIIYDLVDYLVKHHHPRRILLFGSRAKGTARPGSDIDLAVEGMVIDDIRKQRKLHEALDRLARLYMVDLVHLEKVDEPFRQLIEKSGKVLYEKE